MIFVSYASIRGTKLHIIKPYTLVSTDEQLRKTPITNLWTKAWYRSEKQPRSKGVEISVTQATDHAECSYSTWFCCF